MNEREKFEQWWGGEPQEYKLAMTAEEKLSMWVWEAWKARASQPEQEPVAYGIRLPDGRIDTSDEPFYHADEIEYHMKQTVKGCTLAKFYTTPQSEAARIKELEAEVVEYKNKRDVAVSSLELCQERFKACSKALAQQCKYTKELVAKLAKCEKDAERWRYFRETAAEETCYSICGNSNASNEELDSAIDHDIELSILNSANQLQAIANKG